MTSDGEHLEQNPIIKLDKRQNRIRDPKPNIFEINNRPKNLLAFLKIMKLVTF